MSARSAPHCAVADHALRAAVKARSIRRSGRSGWIMPRAMRASAGPDRPCCRIPTTCSTTRPRWPPIPPVVSSSRIRAIIAKIGSPNGTTWRRARQPIRLTTTSSPRASFRRWRRCKSGNCKQPSFRRAARVPETGSHGRHTYCRRYAHHQPGAPCRRCATVRRSDGGRAPSTIADGDGFHADHQPATG